MSLEIILFTLFNGLLYGMFLFMLSSGLTLIFGMMGILNFAHASFFMIGAYLGFQISYFSNFWIALLISPIIVGVMGGLVERYALRNVHKYGHIAELLFTFGLFYIIEELVQMIWGKVPVPYKVPESLNFSLIEISGMSYPAYSIFRLVLSLLIFLAIYRVLSKTKTGLIIKASLTNPQMVSALGHNVPRVFSNVFGFGCALAGLAGVMAGNVIGTEPSMALLLGPIVFVVVVTGGLGSIKGALVASIIIGLMQTIAVSMEFNLNNLFEYFGYNIDITSTINHFTSITISQLSPVVPYLLLIIVLIARPRGLYGKRDV
ncbi:branched-chain amino acid ABC transporter permease [Alphaproteobacteria bacterium]|nr:branched-chain amino acid ABC transporter permease [Alphaproteobacteria bacterium]